MAGPECLPFKTVEDVLGFKPEDFELNFATESLIKRVKVADDVPKTILCHDMRGGYLQDRFVQGCSDPDSYRFYHWQYIDAFIYFSHNLVTVPPPSWTNTAHRHGVQMMGTLITEWDDGKKRCHQIIDSEKTYKIFADKLVEITKHYGMDGWLVNIENVVQADKVQNLCNFVDYLTKQLHDVIPGSCVIWYDSVLHTGQLRWQDELNEKNSMFFDVCDGIFLNYNWKDQTLKNSKELAKSKEREMDVYVGIDVFGRGCLGGGGFNTVEALTAIRQHNMSAAIFAMGWVYETQGEANFLQNENRFWRLLQQLLPVRILSTHHLPFSTSFCQGFGRKYCMQAEVVNNLTWHNLGMQEIQPNMTDAQFEGKPKSSPSMILCTEDSFLGGSCLKLEAHPVPKDSLPVMYRLFCVEFEINEPVVVSYTYKCSDSHLDVFLECEVTCETKSKTFVFRGNSSDSTSQSENTLVFKPITADSLLTSNPSLSQDMVVSKDDHWTTRYYKVDPGKVGQFTIYSISVGLCYPTPPEQHPDSQTVLLGQIQVIPGSCLSTPAEVSDLTCLRSAGQQTRILKWKCTNMSAVKYFNVFAAKESPELVGHSNQSSFVIDNKPVTDGQGDVTPQKEIYIIQPVMKLGFTVPLSNCYKAEV